MKKSSMILTAVLFLYVFAFTLYSCGHKEMSNQDYSSIMQEYSMSLLSIATNTNLSESEIKSKCEKKLDEICKKYGYSVSDFEYKTKQIGKNINK